MTEAEVKTHFSKCGTIDLVTIVRDKETSLGTGIAYIKYHTSEDMLKAIKTL